MRNVIGTYLWLCIMHIISLSINIPNLQRQEVSICYIFMKNIPCDVNKMYRVVSNKSPAVSACHHQYYDNNPQRDWEDATYPTPESSSLVNSPKRAGQGWYCTDWVHCRYCRKDGLYFCNFPYIDGWWDSALKSVKCYDGRKLRLIPSISLILSHK